MSTAAKPKHLERRSWFTVSSVNFHIVAHRATYYRDPVPWENHPWGKNSDRPGQPFRDEWALEERAPDGNWHALGRTCGPDLSLDPKNDYPTLAAARAGACQKASRLIESYREQIAALEAVIEEYTR